MTRLTLEHPELKKVVQKAMGRSTPDRIQMIPGGRFLITIHDEWLFLWDLGNLAEPAGPQGPKLPSLALKYEVPGFENLYRVSVVDNDTIWLPISREIEEA